MTADLVVVPVSHTSLKPGTPVQMTALSCRMVCGSDTDYQGFGDGSGLVMGAGPRVLQAAGWQRDGAE